MKERPNIVLICADQWRGDCLSIDGHPAVHTPYLDQMALGGCRFTSAYSSVPSCIAARAALFTGLSQRTHGRVGYRDGVEWNYDTTLAGEFTRHGYQTQAIGKMHVYPERKQLGFQNVILHDGHLHFPRRQSHRHLDIYDDYIPWLREKLGDPSAEYFDHGLNCNSFAVRPWDKDENLHPTNFIVSQGIDFLRRRDPTKPFFLYLSFHRPHPPLDPPDWALRQYLGMELPSPPVGDWNKIWEKLDNKWDPALTRGKIRPDILRRAQAGYYGLITHIDHQINRFMESLDDWGLDNTWVCFTSDHGELLGDHHLFRKVFPYEGSSRIPLILKWPAGNNSIKNGSVFKQVAELRDVMPTLLECAGLPIPESVEGKSLLPAAQGKNMNWREYIHGEHQYYGMTPHWLTDGKEKYIWCSDTGIEQLFDLENDPQELRDLAASGEKPDRVAFWRSKLVGELTGREEGFVENGALKPGQQPKTCLNHILPK